ncbi:hypothetical protein ST12_08230 [Clostridium botulinum]|uniref:hypothetical protein n=1 Tax=Clostridium botulinum TaxID=1491 RepID=UPI000174E394|nr:hypothetical protein [Clostridium botulinum]ACD52630.1 conserved hypothetical protein [Clostridium botulinum E3 str. Alaska E43]AJF29676.1 hypothetical protein ST13_08230 [Clostridium botulinum]AJF32737.1 hypothetical protein ST12_08230 [Clostridium botulinum]MBY6949065.1 hypothetical protein [Clostridium botulinum]MBY7022815.1 hypothetical protein [Clostridium botulinum]
MYETCKKQYERKIERGLLTIEYVEKQKVYVGIFLMNELLIQEQYQEILELLTVNVKAEDKEVVSQ